MNKYVDAEWKFTANILETRKGHREPVSCPTTQRAWTSAFHLLGILQFIFDSASLFTLYRKLPINGPVLARTVKIPQLLTVAGKVSVIVDIK